MQFNLVLKHTSENTILILNNLLKKALNQFNNIHVFYLYFWLILIKICLYIFNCIQLEKSCTCVTTSHGGRVPAAVCLIITDEKIVRWGDTSYSGQIPRSLNFLASEFVRPPYMLLCPHETFLSSS
jgi:uncharacterized membrane-anchored protein YitT (DUF2179 family)